MNRTTRVSAAVLLLPVIGLLILSFGCGRESEEEREHEAKAKTTSRVAVSNGQTEIKLAREVQSRLGLAVAQVRATTQQTVQRVPVLVLPAQDLAELRNNYVAAAAKLASAKANREPSKKEYERLKTLRENDQNASAKALEAAEASFQSNDAEAGAARQNLATQQNLIQQQWGPVLANWIAHGSPALDAVLEQREFLVQITSPVESSLSMPRRISLELPKGNSAVATLVSRFPRLDPRIQGTAYLYTASAKPGMTAGLNLIARLAQGRALKGVLVPQSAAVWWEGKAWVYWQIADTTFSRQEISTDSSATGGWFVTTGVSPGDKVVVRGAESLLSTELGSQSLGEQGEEEEER